MRVSLSHRIILVIFIAIIILAADFIAIALRGLMLLPLGPLILGLMLLIWACSKAWFTPIRAAIVRFLRMNLIRTWGVQIWNLETSGCRSATSFWISSLSTYLNHPLIHLLACCTWPTISLWARFYTALTLAWCALALLSLAWWIGICYLILVFTAVLTLSVSVLLLLFLLLFVLLFLIAIFIFILLLLVLVSLVVFLLGVRVHLGSGRYWLPLKERLFLIWLGVFTGTTTHEVLRLFVITCKVQQIVSVLENLDHIFRHGSLATPWTWYLSSRRFSTSHLFLKWYPLLLLDICDIQLPCPIDLIRWVVRHDKALFLELLEKGNLFLLLRHVKPQGCDLNPWSLDVILIWFFLDYIHWLLHIVLSFLSAHGLLLEFWTYFVVQGFIWGVFPVPLAILLVVLLGSLTILILVFFFFLLWICIELLKALRFFAPSWGLGVCLLCRHTRISGWMISTMLLINDKVTFYSWELLSRILSIRHFKRPTSDNWGGRLFWHRGPLRSY